MDRRFGTPQDRRYREGLRLHAKLQDKSIVDSIAGLAVTSARRGRVEEAGWLWGAAERVLEDGDPMVWRTSAARFWPTLEPLVADASDAFERGRESALRLPRDEILGRLLDDRC